MGGCGGDPFGWIQRKLLQRHGSSSESGPCGNSLGGPGRLFRPLLLLCRVHSSSRVACLDAIMPGRHRAILLRSVEEYSDCLHEAYSGLFFSTATCVNTRLEETKEA